MHVSLDTIADAIPLNSGERDRLVQLESAIQTHLETFLAVGRALAEIRSRRLFRQEFATFEDYCVKRWGFGGAHGLDLVRSTEVAENLLTGPAAPETGDSPLPDNLSADVLRPLQKLDRPLQSACWRLAARITERPTHHVISQIVRTVQAAINQGSNGTGEPKSKFSQSQKKIFLLSVHRLADNPWFSAHLIIQGVDEARARKHLEAAQQLISRLHELIGELHQQFPEL